MSLYCTYKHIKGTQRDYNNYLARTSTRICVAYIIEDGVTICCFYMLFDGGSLSGRSVMLCPGNWSQVLDCQVLLILGVVTSTADSHVQLIGSFCPDSALFSVMLDLKMCIQLVKTELCVPYLQNVVAYICIGKDDLHFTQEA